MSTHTRDIIAAVDPLYSPNGKYIALTTKACEAFLEYLPTLSDIELAQTLADLDILCRGDTRPEQFEWKRDQCRAEADRRCGNS